MNYSENNEEDMLLPGFRFHPTDEELVGFYLKRKVEKKPISIELIKQIDIYKYDPWDLPKASSLGDKEMYFFCIRGRKYKNSIRPNRVTGSGFWKATGIDRPIYSLGDANDCIGLKKSLVYYRGSAGKGTKTDWMMHEFRLPAPGECTNNHLNKLPNNNAQEAEILTICRIFKRNVSCRKYSQDWGVSAKQNPTDSSSKTCRIDYDLKEKYMCFESSTIQHIEMKPPFTHIEEKNQVFSGPLNSMAQTPFTALNSNFSNPNSVEYFRDPNWDEMGSIMEFVIDPAIVHDCRYTI